MFMQHLGNGSEVAALERIHEALQHRAFLPGRIRRGRPIHATLRQVLLQGGSRPLQSAVDGGNACLEQRSCFLSRPAEHVAHDQHRSLARRQQLDRGEERDLDRLPGHDHDVRLVVARGDSLQQMVGIRLQPWKICRGQRRVIRVRRRAQL
jgi:hypothetical protein